MAWNNDYMANLELSELQKICEKAREIPVSDWRIIKGEPQCIGKGYLFSDEGTDKYQCRTMISTSVDEGRILVIRNDVWLGDKAEFLPLFYEVLYKNSNGKALKATAGEGPFFQDLFDKVVYKK